MATQLQFLRELPLTLLSLQVPPPVLQHPGIYLQKTSDMALSKDLNYSSKGKALQGQQPFEY